MMHLNFTRDDVIKAIADLAEIIQRIDAGETWTVEELASAAHQLSELTVALV